MARVVPAIFKQTTSRTHDNPVDRLIPARHIEISNALRVRMRVSALAERGARVAAVGAETRPHSMAR